MDTDFWPELNDSGRSVAHGSSTIYKALKFEAPNPKSETNSKFKFSNVLSWLWILVIWTFGFLFYRLKHPIPVQEIKVSPVQGIKNDRIHSIPPNGRRGGP
jgi:hypothetical protein